MATWSSENAPKERRLLLESSWPLTGRTTTGRLLMAWISVPSKLADRSQTPTYSIKTEFRIARNARVVGASGQFEHWNSATESHFLRTTAIAAHYKLCGSHAVAAERQSESIEISKIFRGTHAVAGAVDRFDKWMAEIGSM